MMIRSKWWFLLPIIFHVIGGAIAYFEIKKDDPKLAMSCLLLGMTMTIVVFLSRDHESLF